MKAYLAGLNAEQQNRREIVGIFFAGSNRALCDLVDECCNIDAVEVMELPAGGIYWGDSVDYVIPYPGEIEHAPHIPGGARKCENWLSAFYDENKGKWQQLEWGEMELVLEDDEAG